MVRVRFEGARESTATLGHEGSWRFDPLTLNPLPEVEGQTLGLSAIARFAVPNRHPAEVEGKALGLSASTRFAVPDRQVPERELHGKASPAKNRRGFSTVIISICSALTPASRSRGATLRTK